MVYLCFMRVGTDFGREVGHLADVCNHGFVGLALYVRGCGWGGLRHLDRLLLLEQLLLQLLLLLQQQVVLLSLSQERTLGAWRRWLCHRHAHAWLALLRFRLLLLSCRETHDDLVEFPLLLFFADNRFFNGYRLKKCNLLVEYNGNSIYNVIVTENQPMNRNIRPFPQNWKCSCLNYGKIATLIFDKKKTQLDNLVCFLPRLTFFMIAAKNPRFFMTGTCQKRTAFIILGRIYLFFGHYFWGQIHKDRIISLLRSFFLIRELNITLV